MNSKIKKQRKLDKDVTDLRKMTKKETVKWILGCLVKKGY